MSSESLTSHTSIKELQSPEKSSRLLSKPYKLGFHQHIFSLSIFAVETLIFTEIQKYLSRTFHCLEDSLTKKKHPQNEKCDYNCLEKSTHNSQQSTASFLTFSYSRSNLNNYHPKVILHYHSCKDHESYLLTTKPTNTNQNPGPLGFSP